MDLILIGIGIFVSVILLIEGIFFLARLQTNPELKRVRKQLTLLTREDPSQEYDISKKKKRLSDIPLLDRILSSIPVLYRIEKLLVQADFQYPLGAVLLTCAIFFMLGIIVTSFVFNSILFKIAFGIAASFLPILYISYLKNKRSKKFERQLPDAMALMARAMKAGHAFSGAMQMLTTEFDNPISGEFKKVVDEVNFGIGLENALSNLTERVNSQDIKFFAISVIVQRETGGNLAEILEKISDLIRERFKLMEKVHTLSAEGRLSAIILVCIPILVALALSIINPKYMNILRTDSIGNVLIVIAVIMAGFGLLIMKKMIAIKV